MVAAGGIQASKLCKRFGKIEAVRGLDLDVAPGAIYGLIGPDGAGKTTTIRILMALLRADSGTARIAGMDCWERSVDIKKLIGYVPGEPSLDPDLTGGQILEYFAHLRGGVDQTYLKELVDRFGLQKLKDTLARMTVKAPKKA